MGLSENLLILFYLKQDAEENYMLSIKKSIVDYVLMDQTEQERLGVQIPPQVCSLE